ncbi:hypothetical protein ABHF33_11800 [Chitinibacter sp. FCG-7]|uniref:Lipoprotein n=1 Tax=Chitinibacter mangrovi TaxID=3153927 RepID=A0AAU7F825_9NEIS
MKALKTLLLMLPLTLALSACDQLLEAVNKPKANGKAIGAACRHSGRSLEDCYRRNAKVAKSDIFAGWKEMNEYMQSKKIDIVPPPPDVTTGQLSPMEAAAEDPAAQAGSETASAASAVAHKTQDKSH